MSRGWYYSHNGRRHGPVTVKQLRALAATGGLMPEDRVWREGSDEDHGTPASQALDFAALRRAAQEAHQRGEDEDVKRVPHEAAPAWREEMDHLFREPEQAVGPVPDWMRPEPPPGHEVPDWVDDLRAAADTPSAPPAPAPEPAEAPPLAFPVDFAAQADAELPPPRPYDADPFRAARKQLAAWVESEKNQERAARGDWDAVRQDPIMLHYFRHFEKYGPEKCKNLRDFLEFLIESRASR